MKSINELNAGSKTPSRLRSFREAANFTQRELASLIGQHYSNISFWESNGKLPPAELLPALTKALNVSVEELLGIDHQQHSRSLRGKTFLAFEAVSKLPYKKQKRILEVVNALVAQHCSRHMKI